MDGEKGHSRPPPGCGPPDPPFGVAQPNSSRPLVMLTGRAPVPLRVGGWKVAKPIHISTRRVTSCSNSLWTTSQALCQRSASYAIPPSPPPVGGLQDRFPLPDQLGEARGIVTREHGDLLGRALG